MTHKLLLDRLRFHEAWKMMFHQPHRIGIRSPMWRGAFLGLMRLERKVTPEGLEERLYFDGDPKFPVRLDASELLSEEWETYEISNRNKNQND